MFDWWMSGGSVSKIEYFKNPHREKQEQKNDRFSSRPKKPPFLPRPQKTPLFRGKQQKSAIFPKNPLF